MTIIPENATPHAIVLAPRGRDAELGVALLRHAGITSTTYADLAEVAKALDDAAFLVIVTEEQLRLADLRTIGSWVAAQPAWSDLPFIVLTQKNSERDRVIEAERLSEIMRNVTFLERPFHPTTFVSVVRAAVKARRRQYESRTRLEELHESEARLHTALAAGHLGSWELDTDTEELHASPDCKACFGRKADRPFTYADLLQSVHPEDRAKMQLAVRRSIETGSDYASQYRTIWPDGSVHWADFRARLMTNRTGKQLLVGVASDVTARKLAEDYLVRLNETLEDRVAERTSELKRVHAVVLEENAQRQRAEALLRQSQKVELLGQLTGGVAHDFNNLLMAVMGNLDLLGKRLAHDGRATRLIEGAMAGAKRGAALTQRLLAFARRQDLTVQPLSLVDLVRGMSDLLIRSVGRQAEVVLELPENVPYALVDANQLELALLNLVVNARDAMPNGGQIVVSIDVVNSGATDELEAGNYVRLIVTDTGHGMDEETLKRATEPFFSTKELGKGTGLGLSMIHGLALQLNGALHLQSEVNRGTRAELWLPVTDVVAETNPVAEPTPSPDQIPKMTILLVDDDVLISMSTVDMLEDLGHEVVECNSGEAALEVLRRPKKIDLMITDFSMPKMNGAQLAQAARDIYPDLPILLATGYAELPPGFELGLPRLGKPYQQKDLATEIAKLTRV